jgi:hypothetical protein
MSTLAFLLAIALGAGNIHYGTVFSHHQHVQPVDSLGQQGGG